MHKFENLLIWKKGMEIATRSYKITTKFPNSEKYGLVSQITRAAVSIPSNIAEGCSRSSSRDYCRFLEIALGSCFELETQLAIAQNINMGDRNEIDAGVKLIKEKQKMIASLLNKIKTNQRLEARS